MKSHILLEPNPRYQRAVVCGSPERAKTFASYLKNSTPLAQNREYHSYMGEHEGHDILVVSHGVGGAGAAICFQELISVGVKSLIRIGTAGGLYDELQIGDVVVPTAAVRKDGVSQLMVPRDFPAVPDFTLTQTLIAHMHKQGWRGRFGTIVTSDLFYPGLLDDELALYQKAGAVAVEMECSTLFVVGQLRQVRTAAVLVCDGNPLKWTEGVYDPRPERLAQSMQMAWTAAIQTLVS